MGINTPEAWPGPSKKIEIKPISTGMSQIWKPSNDLKNYFTTFALVWIPSVHLRKASVFLIAVKLSPALLSISYSMNSAA